LAIYILNLVLILFWAVIIYGYKTKEKSRIFLIITGVQLFLISALRGSTVGTDTNSYLITYNTFVNFNFVDYARIEIGYKTLMRITSILGEKPQWIIITTSIIIIIMIYKGIEHTSSQIWLSVFLFVALYYFYNSFNGIRQYIAIAISFYGYRFILKEKFIKYIVCVLIAMLFHTTAIIMLPVYFFGKIKLNFKKSFGLFLLIMLLSFILDKLLIFTTKLLPQYTGYLNSFLFSETGGFMSSVVTGCFVLFGIYIFIFEKTNRQFLIEFQIIIISFAVSLMSMFKYIGFDRIGWYFTIYSILFIPNSLKLVSNHKLKATITYLVLCVVFAYNIYFLINNQQRIVPFIPFFTI